MAWLRPIIGDFVHISVLQSILVYFKLFNPSSSALLFTGGYQIGLMLESIGAISRIINGHKLDAPPIPPMKLSQACDVLGRYFNSPGITSSKIHADVVIDLIDDENAIIKVWESASSSGLDLFALSELQYFPGVVNNDLHRHGKLDDFLAGYINGRFDILVENPLSVEEVSCQALGHPYCEFHVKFL
ncbi:4-vinyl reductase, partial [Candidatus Pacearchaeota archaeon]|nr:4-vinyl reductase [Candidatus Pacearchaeota archaeon]